MGSSGEQPGRGQRAQPRRADLDPLQPRRRGRARQPKWGWWPEGFLHEMTHNLGAVQWGAPHSTQPRGQTQPAVRPLLAGRGRHVLRRGRRRLARDADRLRRAPRRDPAELRLRPRRLLQPGAGPGSYLATHWNTYDYVFLAPCGEVAPACGGGQLWVPEPPAATSAPIGGRQRPPRLDAHRPHGHLEQQPERLRLPVAAPVGRRLGGHRRRDATPTYVATSEDLGRRLRVSVIATNDDGSVERRVGPDGSDRCRRRQPRGQQDLQEGQAQAGRSRPRLRQEEEGRQEEVGREEEGQGQGQEERASAGRAQCRDGRVATRQAHPRVAGPAATRTSSARSS